MPVEKVFWEEPYKTEIKSKVTSVNDNKVTVDKTIVYALSGGQESDSGTISDYEILKAEKNDKDIIYTIDDNHNLKVNDEVIIKIDWDKRYRLMRLHFAGEAVLQIVNQNFNEPDRFGSNIHSDKARIDFMWDGNIKEMFPVIEEKLKELVNNDLEIITGFTDEKSQKRYWEIKGFAKAICGGTHPKRTSEIGKINLKRKNLGAGKERIEITLA